MLYSLTSFADASTPLFVPHFRRPVPSSFQHRKLATNYTADQPTKGPSIPSSLKEINASIDVARTIHVVVRRPAASLQPES